jgi:spore maturation protein CgeB
MELVRTRQGSYSLRIVGSDGAEKTCHSLYDPEGEAAGMADAFSFGGEGILVVLGLGLGYHLDALRRRYPHADIVVVEAKREILDLCRTHGKGAEPSDKVRFLVETPPAEAVAEISRLHLKAGLPPLVVFSLAPEASAFPGYYGPIREALGRTVSFRLWDRLRYPKFRSDRLTVALFDFGYFLTEEIVRALEALGHAVVRVRGRKDETCAGILGRAVETIASARPDFFLTVNHFGFDEDGALADLFRSIEMPAAVWYVDSPDLVVRAFPKNVSPFCCVFVWDGRYMESMRSLGFENVAYLPLASDETVFRPWNLSSAEKRKIGADVGFVGNSMVAPAREWLLKVPRELREAVERTARRLGASRDIPVREAADAAMHDGERAAFEASTAKEKSVFEAAVLWRATLLYRLSRLRALEEFRPFVRGDAGWKGLLNGKFRLGPQLNYYEELPSFYNACKVNFNATSVQMGTAVNQRVFDVPASGAFLLTDHQASVEALFEVGEEVVTYREPDEIDDLARFYLGNDAAREAVAAKGRSRVLREHTYRHRVGAIVRRLRELYG